MVVLEPAQTEEAERCMDIINQGKEFQREQGFTQWTEDYPNLDTIRNDIQNRKGYVLKKDDRIVGYLYIDFDGEPAYVDIQGEWRTKEPYAVIHRMAFQKEARGMGLADAVFELAEQLCVRKGVYSIRVDTDFPNKRMQHVLKKNGFENCGRVVFQGSEKLAFDKSIR